MQTTPSSLLVRLRQPGEQQAWARFVELYAPLLYDWARRFRLQPDDAADLVQDVFVILVRKLPEFVDEPGKRFRGWLWTVVHNAWRSRLRKAGRGPRADPADPDELAAPEAPSEMEAQEYSRYLISRGLRVVRDDFQPTTWKAFEEHVIAGRPAAEVAAELGVTVNAVHLARSRILRRLRAELAGLLD
jgi:RNA polymerase sigma-70 factor (ECF subfamily)